MLLSVIFLVSAIAKTLGNEGEDYFLGQAAYYSVVVAEFVLVFLLWWRSGVVGATIVVLFAIGSLIMAWRFPSAECACFGDLIALQVHERIIAGASVGALGSLLLYFLVSGDTRYRRRLS
jgi:hypothetical protein